MKIKTMVLGCLASLVILAMGYEYSQAQPKADEPSLKIGVISIQRIFLDSERNAKYMEEAIAEQRRLEAQLDKLAKEIEAERAGLRALKPRSSDYLASVKEIFEKEAKLKAQQDFYKLQIELKDLRWNEELYKDVLREVYEVAEQKGLDLVFDKSEPELPTSSAIQFKLDIRTHKLLYSGGCLDITDEVLARLDKEE